MQGLAEFGQRYAQSTRTGRVLEGRADRMERVDSQNPREGRGLRASQARAAADGYGGGPAARSIQASAQAVATGSSRLLMSGGSEPGTGGAGSVLPLPARGGAAADNTHVSVRFLER
jgi:hypothetical protein